jgi:hypothetical protein
LLCFFYTQSNAQKVLQLEKGGVQRTVKIHIGETITFKLKNDDTGWYERTIFDIYPNTGHLNLEGVQVHIDSIAKLKFEKRPFVPHLVGTALQGGGANMILFDLSRGLIWDKERGVDGGTIISGAANIGIGTLLKKIFSRKKFKVTKRKRLRLLDLDFGPSLRPITNLTTQPGIQSLPCTLPVLSQQSYERTHQQYSCAI